jgi:hypothetical protein
MVQNDVDMAIMGMGQSPESQLRMRGVLRLRSVSGEVNITIWVDGKLPTSSVAIDRSADDEEQAHFSHLPMIVQQEHEACEFTGP